MKTRILLVLLTLSWLPALAQEPFPEAAPGTAPTLATDIVPDSDVDSEAAIASMADEAAAGETTVDYFARDTYRVDTVVCPFKGQIDYEPGDIECGLLEVPENREDPDSRFIELHFVKLNSRWGKDEDEDEAGDEEEDSGLAPGKRDDPVR